MSEADPILTVAEAAKRRGCHPNTILKAIHRGTLPAKTGLRPDANQERYMVRQSDLDWLGDPGRHQVPRERMDAATFRALWEAGEPLELIATIGRTSKKHVRLYAKDLGLLESEARAKAKAARLEERGRRCAAYLRAFALEKDRAK